MDLFRFVAGFVLLLFGRKLFWLFVGVSGFLAGLLLTEQFFLQHPLQVRWIISLMAGLIGMIFAIFLQRFAVVAGGFLTGVYLLFLLSGGLAPEFRWIALLTGGILGAFLLNVFFDWALIGFSSLLGASLMIESAARNFGMRIWMEHLLYFALVIIGFLIQGNSKKPASTPS